MFYTEEVSRIKWIFDRRQLKLLVSLFSCIRHLLWCGIWHIFAFFLKNLRCMLQVSLFFHLLRHLYINGFQKFLLTSLYLLKISLILKELAISVAYRELYLENNKSGDVIFLLVYFYCDNFLSPSTYSPWIQHYLMRTFHNLGCCYFYQFRGYSIMLQDWPEWKKSHGAKSGELGSDNWLKTYCSS